MMNNLKSKVSVLPQPCRDFSRRRFLQGIGIAMALPAMESSLPRGLRMASAASEAAALVATTATGAPLRTAFLYFPNGAIPAAWWPKGSGKEFTLSRTMEPLANVKDKIQILGGLGDVSANPGPDGGGDHARATPPSSPACASRRPTAADFHAGISADQIMAQQVGLVTPFRSLELSCDVVLNAGACDTDYACVYQHNLAWTSPTTPLSPEVNPRLLFERLFGQRVLPKIGLATCKFAKSRSVRFSISCKASVPTWCANASQRDRDKIEEYFTGVRDIEQRIAAAESSRSGRPQPDQDTPDGIPINYSEYVRLMYDMLVLAFQTDSTRIATFMIAGDGNNRDFSEIGISDGHHNLTHHGNRPDWIEKVTQIDVWYVQQLAYFLEKMEATKDIDGNSLLHNSQIVYGSGCSDGNRHSHIDLPIILAGSGGGTLNPGRYVRFNNLPICNLT